MTMRPLIAGNWKMHGLTADSAELAQALRRGVGALAPEMLVCPPATQIAAVAAALEHSGVAVGGQDCHAETQGAHTGEISAAMLRDVGASFVILGHSERRADQGETDALVAAKARAAVAAGLVPIICVGESGAERAAGQAETVVERQLAGSLCEDFAGVIAYEPIWAIGTGRVPTLDDITCMHRVIRDHLLSAHQQGATVRILYGGSVKPGNAAEILKLPEVGGALVGGASLVAADFLAIAAAAPGVI
jgi:triosephosphate isomerase (TIM)